MKTLISKLITKDKDVKIEKIQIDDVEQELSDVYSEIRDEAEGILSRAKDSVYVISPECSSILSLVKRIRKENNDIYYAIIDNDNELKDRSSINSCLNKLFNLRASCLSVKYTLDNQFRRNFIKSEI